MYAFDEGGVGHSFYSSFVSFFFFCMGLFFFFFEMHGAIGGCVITNLIYLFCITYFRFWSLGSCRTR